MYPLYSNAIPIPKRNPLIAFMRLYQFLALDTLVVADFTQFAAAFYLSDKRHLSHAPSLLLSVKTWGFHGWGRGMIAGST